MIFLCFRFSVRDFLGKVCKYSSLRDVVTPNLNKISSFLEKNPQYGGISQLEIDYNLIEVSMIFDYLMLYPITYLQILF